MPMSMPIVSERTVVRVCSVFVLFTAGIVCGNCWGSIARASAQDRHGWSLALMVARTSMNESGGNDKDTVLIHQAATRNGTRSHREAVRWLRRHSARVNGHRECLPDRPCRWSRHLRWNDRRPAEYPSHLRWDVDLWRAVKRHALAMVRGQAVQRVCPVDIVSWGSRADMVDNRFGLIAVRCGARNLGATTVAIRRRWMRSS